MSEGESPQGSRLNELLAEAGLASISDAQAKLFDIHLSLFVRWNTRINLSSIREEDAILSRNFVESIVCARALPGGFSTLLDFGSGGGFPGIPIAICRPETAVTLAESQGKKAAFLQEVVRALGISAKVYGGRAELLTERFGCVTMRAVDRMPEAVEAAASLVASGGWLALMTTGAELSRLQSAAGTEFSWSPAIRLPGGTDRHLLLGQAMVSSRA